MEKRVLPGANKNLSAAAASVGGLLSSSGACLVTRAGPLLENLTRSQRIIAAQRQVTLDRVEQYKSHGKTTVEAARLCGTSAISLWRWRTKGVIPQTARCGRKPDFREIEMPAELLAEIRYLQTLGLGNSRAWKQMADSPLCPPKVATHLRTGKSVNKWLLSLTRLKGRTAKEFTHAE